MDGLSVAASIVAVIQATQLVIGILKGVSEGADGLNERSRLAREAINLLGYLTTLENLIAFCEADSIQYRTIEALTIAGGPLEQYKRTCERLQHKLRPVNGSGKVVRVLTWCLDKEEFAAILGQIERLKSSVQFAINVDNIQISSSIKADTSFVKNGVNLLQDNVGTVKNSIRLVQDNVEIVKISTGDVKDEIQLVKQSVGIANTGINHVGKGIGVLQTDVSAVKDSINIAVGDVSTLKGSVEDEMQARWRKELLNRICSTDYSDEHFDHLQRHELGTGEWFLTDPKFTAWITASRVEHRTLLCTGNPGAGKTILAAISVEHLRRMVHTVQTPVLHIYCNYKRQEEQSGLHMISSLLRQLLAIQTSIPEQVERLFNCAARPSYKDINESLQSMTRSCTPIFIIIDALDECRAEARSQLLASLSELRKLDCVQILATTRHGVPGIDSFFVNNTSIEITASNHDIERFARGRFHSFPETVQNNLNLQNQIVLAVLDASEGIFLVAKLHMESLESKETVRQIKVALQSLRKNVNAYEAAYDATMERINRQNSERRAYAKKILSWLVCAQNHLSIDAIQLALAVEIGDKEIDVDNILPAKQILSFCAGLVIIEPHGRIVRLVHFTTQEYLSTHQSKWLPGAEKYLTRTCWAYLSMGIWKTPTRTSLNVVNSVDENGLLALYMANYWNFHFSEARKNTTDDLLGEEYFPEAAFLQSSQGVLSVYRLLGMYIWDKESEPSGTSAAHILARLGLLEMLKFWVKGRDESSWLNNKCCYGLTPLQSAAHGGHKDVVDWLLSFQNLEPDVKCPNGSTALTIACECGHSNVVASLLAYGTIDVNATTKSGETPLMKAVRKGHSDVFQLLMANDEVDVDARDSTGISVLYSACTFGNTEMVNSLLARKVETIDALCLTWDSDEFANRTALAAAAANGHLAIVQSLLKVNANIEIGDHSPLSWASQHCEVEVMKLLLEHGASIGSKDRYGQTPLQRVIAFQRENSRSEDVEAMENTINLLIQYSPDLTEASGMSVSGLFNAAITYGNNTALKILLQKFPLGQARKGSLLFDAIERNGRKWFADQNQQAMETTRLLLSAGAPVDTRDARGRTPLLCAVQDLRHDTCQDDIMCVLLAKGADMEAADNNGVSALNYFEDRLKANGRLSRRKSLLYSILCRWKTNNSESQISLLTPEDESKYGEDVWDYLHDSENSGYESEGEENRDSTDDEDEQQVKKKRILKAEDQCHQDITPNSTWLEEVTRVSRKRPKLTSSLTMSKKRQR
ncbi:ankyrin, protein [Acrodontium crateriforme]|uniref:Ankyrin, protein n=1 Tax=Acrodontium crateriforme TaxID=150365 RepID=A0AAQ3R9E6_9PEZI|nr:ankyrin, protein [Acrodontium crateriforme]